jgi:hypothetical protein
MTTEQLEVGSRQSVFLKKTLRQMSHSPYSLWPSGRRPSMEPRVADFGSLASLHAASHAATISSITPEMRQRRSSASRVSVRMMASSLERSPL